MHSQGLSRLLDNLEKMRHGRRQSCGWKKTRMRSPRVEPNSGSKNMLKLSTGKHLKNGQLSMKTKKGTNGLRKQGKIGKRNRNRMTQVF